MSSRKHLRGRRGRDESGAADEAAPAAAGATRRRELGPDSVHETPAAADEGEWEDVDTSSDGDDDDDVDERFDDVVEEEIVDEDGCIVEPTEGGDAEGGAEGDERRVRFADEPDESEPQVWRRKAGSAEPVGPLAYNNRAYDCFFQLRSEYACLSFDIVRDNDGDARTKYPLGMSLVCGTQADAADRNQLYVLHIHNLLRTKHDVDSDEDSDEDNVFGARGSESDEDEDAAEKSDEEDVPEVNNGEPLVDFKTVKHHGTVNRLRSNPHRPGIVASWSEEGNVHVYSIESEQRSMVDFSGWSRDMAARGTRKPPPSLQFISPAESHTTEGYGLNWSTLSPHAFASGDCAGQLFVWRPTDGGRWAPLCQSKKSPGRSIEEIRFSPTQANVLIAARAGGDVEVWDERAFPTARVTWRADPTDINVCDWNPTTSSSHLLVTGADSGVVAVWDLRYVTQANPQPLQQLTFHQGSRITSVEFSNFNESVLAVTSDDGQCTLWDLSLERDPDEEREVMGELFGRGDTVDLPDQLMFQHQGLNHPKEVHWHPQIPGLVVTTDYDGLHIFKPMNWKSLMK